MQTLLCVISTSCSNLLIQTFQYSETTAQWTYRLSFAFVLILTLWLLYYRIFKAKGSFDNVISKAKKRGGVTGYDTASLNLALGHYNGRIIATAGTWFANDFFFCKSLAIC